MALLQCGFYSNVLGMESSMNVFLPAGIKHKDVGADFGDIPVLYLLHGFTEDHTAWIRRTALERYLFDKNLIVVMPNCHRSFYIDMQSGPAYFRFLSEELPRLVQTMFHASDKREDTFAAGLSMGGYGAFKLALTCPDKFAGAASLSGAMDINMVFEEGEHMNETDAVFGNAVKPENDLYALLDKCAEKGCVPYLYQACGTEDFLYQYNTAFRDYAENRVPHYTYRQSAGAHNWDFWEEYVRYVLDWIAEINPKIKG